MMLATRDDRLVLAIDLGTSGCKCALVTLDGQVQAWAFRPVALHVQGVLAEQDPHEWWQALVSAAGELLASDATRRRRVASVCCSTQTEVTVCVDRMKDQKRARARTHQGLLPEETKGY